MDTCGHRFPQQDNGGVRCLLSGETGWCCGEATCIAFQNSTNIKRIADLLESIGPKTELLLDAKIVEFLDHHPELDDGSEDETPDETLNSSEN